MTTKQYIGLLALICPLGSGFAANQWLKFAKAQHTYQRQLADEKQQEQIKKERLTQTEINALLKAYAPPIDKAWDQFQQDINSISDSYRLNDDIQVWCNNVADAIYKKDFTLFHYLISHIPPQDSWLCNLLHFPDLHMPGLTPADIADLSKFGKPET